MSKAMERAALVLIVIAVALFAFPIPMAHATIEITSLEDKEGNPKTTGVKGDVVVVKGGGVTAGVTVELYWDAVKSWDGEKGLLNSTEAKADGTFEVWFTVPEAVNGAHYLWVKDTATGETYGGAAVANSLFTVEAVIELSPSSGLPGDEVTITGYGFSGEKDIVTITFGGVNLATDPATPKTDELGTWSATFEVPSMAYGDYVVYAEDEEGISAQETFTIGASITLTPESGPVGVVVEVRGRGFTANAAIDPTDPDSYVELWRAGAEVEDCYVIDAPIDINADGEFRMEIVIPNAPAVDDDYEIRVADTEGVSASADFEVLGLAAIEVEPGYGVQGASINIHGYNFTQIKNTEVELYLDGTYVDTLKTDENGEFVDTFTVPAVASGIYTLEARQVDYHISATEDFRVGLMIIILSPNEGPTGTRVTLTGAGFTPNEDWNATFDGTVIEDAGVVDGAGQISKVFYIPTVDPGTYTVTALDIDSGIKVEATFTVTEKTHVELDPAAAPNGYNVTIKGWHFADEVTTLTFVLYNETDEWTLDVMQGSPGVPAETNDDGNFTAWWIVPDADVLGLGEYTLNVTDGEDLFAQATFTIVEETKEISPRKTEYNIGDTIAFNIKSSFKQVNSYIKIYDPEGNLFWKTDPFKDENWLKVDLYYTVPYYSQVAGGNPMILPPDAPTGTWSWTWYEADGDEIASGTFTVIPAVEVLLEERIASVEESVQSLSEDVAGLSEDIAGVKSDIAALKSDVAAAASAAKDAKEAASAAQEAVAQIADTANAAKAAAEEAKAAAEEAKTAASGLTPLIYGAIGVSLIAALAAIVSLIQISRRIAG
ncbi:hypothetical protein DRO49_01085 [Candidatus Bathyarchaeota archaeon]|nr:MAG: hypothetical protein DRO49_01085 [Candidatus Bathyarchaeota archaeon]